LLAVLLSDFDFLPSVDRDVDYLCLPLVPFAILMTAEWILSGADILS